MTRRRRSGKKAGGRRRYYPHIYFESKIPRTRDSVTQAVRDIGRPGVNTAKEVKLLALAQLADYVDGKTVDHHGRVVKFTARKWSGRYLILLRLAKKYGGITAVKKIARYKKLIDQAKTRKEKIKLVLKAARELGISPSTAKAILRKVTQK